MPAVPPVTIKTWVSVYQYSPNTSLVAVYLSSKIRDVFVWIKLVTRDEVCHVEMFCVQVAEDPSTDSTGDINSSHNRMRNRMRRGRLILLTCEVAK